MASVIRVVLIGALLRAKAKQRDLSERFREVRTNSDWADRRSDNLSAFRLIESHAVRINSQSSKIYTTTV